MEKNSQANVRRQTGQRCCKLSVLLGSQCQSVLSFSVTVYTGREETSGLQKVRQCCILLIESS